MTHRSLFAVDAGGSRTRVLVAPARGGKHAHELPSINQHATGLDADETLGELFAVINDLLGGEPAIGWLASASVPDGRAGPELDRIRLAANRAGLLSALVISNDVFPLLWGVPALAGEGVVVVCGTGSCVLGADKAGRTARAGGCEYLGSDEGSATDIGWHGLRAAVRAADGRGPATGLAGALAATTGSPPGELARQIAAQPFPKQRLARLAPAVCAAWREGDEVAGGIIDAAMSELALGVRAVRDQLALPAGFGVAAVGGVLTGCAEFYRELARRLRSEAGAGHVNLITDTVTTVLTCLTTLLGPASRLSLPPGLADRHAWICAS